MIELTLTIFWSLWLLFVFVAAARVFGFLFGIKSQEKRWGNGSKDQKPAALIIPVKGFDPQSTPRFFDSIFGQDYSNFRVIVCFESWQDPVAVWLCRQFDLRAEDATWHHPDTESGLRSVTLVCAGTSEREGQKVHNQRAAFESLADGDEIIAFADSDIICKDDWLARLVAPINQKTHPLSTTYRWLIPKRPTLPNQIASVINGSITTQGGSEATNVLWGGSMAIARSVFNKLEVPTLLEGSLNDDLRLSKAARKVGHKVAFVRSLVIPTRIDFDWKSFFEFAKRQYTQVKFFSPILFTGTNFVLAFYAAGAISLFIAIAYGIFEAWIPVAAAYIIDQFRALARQQIYLRLFEENGIRRKLFSASWLEHILTPLWMLLHWLIVVSTWTQSKITWAGIRYQIISKSKTKILDRPVVAERLPVGAPGLAMLAAIHDRQRIGYTSPIKPMSYTSPADIAPDAPETASPTHIAAATTATGAAVAASGIAAATVSNETMRWSMNADSEDGEVTILDPSGPIPPTDGAEPDGALEESTDDPIAGPPASEESIETPPATPSVEKESTTNEEQSGDDAAEPDVPVYLSHPGPSTSVVPIAVSIAGRPTLRLKKQKRFGPTGVQSRPAVLLQKTRATPHNSRVTSPTASREVGASTVVAEPTTVTDSPVRQPAPFVEPPVPTTAAHRPRRGRPRRGTLSPSQALSSRSGQGGRVGSVRPARPTSRRASARLR